MRWIAAVVASSLLGGCATTAPTLRFAKQGASQQAFMQDRYQCALQGRQQVSAASFYQGSGSAYSTMAVNRGLFTSCMALRGYRMDEKGALVAPPDQVIMLVD